MLAIDVLSLAGAVENLIIGGNPEQQKVIIQISDPVVIATHGEVRAREILNYYGTA